MNSLKKCPRCKEKKLTKEEYLVNKYGNLNLKVVCKSCTKEVIENFNKEYSNSIINYYDLPYEFRFHFNKEI